MNTPVRTQWVGLAPGFDAYLALPPAGRGPGLILFQEIFGVNHHIRTVAEQYAGDGFVVLAPDVFWRQRARIELGYADADRQQGIALANACQAVDLLDDITLAVTTLRERPEVGTRKVGALGYCMGGRLAWLAATSTAIDAAVPFYGGGIHNLLDRAADIRCPLQFHYAERDAYIPAAAVEQVRQALVGHTAEVHVYPGADHGFNCWERNTYDARSAALAHGRATAFLAEHLF